MAPATQAVTGPRPGPAGGQLPDSERRGSRRRGPTVTEFKFEAFEPDSDHSIDRPPAEATPAAGSDPGPRLRRTQSKSEASVSGASDSDPAKLPGPITDHDRHASTQFHIQCRLRRRRGCLSQAQAFKLPAGRAVTVRHLR